MFLIFGINQKEKQLDFDQLAVCSCCGRYGHVSVWMRYTYFMLFFIPIFKWNRHYFVRMNCCGAACELDSVVGRDIEWGRASALNMDDLHFSCQTGTVRSCSYCGYTTAEDFVYCPKCGRPMSGL